MRVREGFEAKVECLCLDVSMVLGIEGGGNTPFTICVPTRVTCPFMLSLRGLLITRVLPGSMGARRA